MGFFVTVCVCVNSYCSITSWGCGSLGDYLCNGSLRWDFGVEIKLLLNGYLGIYTMRDLRKVLLPATT